MRVAALRAAAAADEAARNDYWAFFMNLDVRPLLTEVLRPAAYAEFRDELMAAMAIAPSVFGEGNLRAAARGAYATQLLRRMNEDLALRYGGPIAHGTS